MKQGHRVHSWVLGALGGTGRPGGTWASEGLRSLHQPPVLMSQRGTHTWYPFSSPSQPLPHPLWSQSSPGDLCQGGSVPTAQHPCCLAALAAAMGKPARPPDHAGPGGPHVTGRVPSVSAPVGPAPLSRWSGKPVQSGRGQEGLQDPLSPPLPLLSLLPLSLVWRGPTQHGQM